MTDKWNTYEEYLTQAIDDCKEKEQQLIKEERKDEANLCKIEQNIYDIIKTLVKVSLAQSPQDRAAFVKKKADYIMGTWQQSYEKAKAHDDAEKILIEEIKLKAAQDALAKLPEGEAV